MRICVYGAGSTGGNFATRLAAAGSEVSVVVRGAPLEAIRANGLTPQSGDRKLVTKVAASDRPEDLGPQDQGQGQGQAPDVPGRVAGWACPARSISRSMSLVTRDLLIGVPRAHGANWKSRHKTWKPFPAGA